MVRWNEAKNKQLQERRGVSFDRIAQHEIRPNQQVLVIKIDGYCWAVPFVIEEDGQTIFFKTAYPSRKLHKRYGGEE